MTQKAPSGSCDDPVAGDRNGAAGTIPGCIRKMNNIERVFYRIPGYNVTVVARVRGNVSETGLRRALGEVSRMHPLAGARVVFDRQHTAWFSVEDIPAPSLRVVPRDSDTAWLAEVQAENRIAFEPEISPMIRFVLLHSPEVSDLVIISSHAICDGMALANLVRDILANYADPGQETAPVYPPEMTEYLPVRKNLSPKALPVRIVTAYANYRWRKNPYFFSREDYEAINTAFWDKREFGVVLLALEPGETAELSSRCHENGVSIGSAVTAAFIAAREDISGPFTGNFRTVSIPFDLRRHAARPVGDVFCLCAGSAEFPFSYDHEKPFRENAAALNSAIREHVGRLDTAFLELLDFDPTFLDAVACFAGPAVADPGSFPGTKTLARFRQDTDNIAYPVVRRYLKSAPGIISSNVGKLEIPETYGDLRIDRMLFIPPIRESVPLFLGGATIAGRMVYSMSFARKKDDPSEKKTEEMIRIRNRALEYLGFPGNANADPLG